MRINRLIFICLLLSFSCTSKEKKENERVRSELKNSESLLRVNRYLANKYYGDIKNYAQRHNLEMQTTQTGLWYDIYKKGDGIRAQKGKTIVYNFTVKLLDGTLCYKSGQNAPGHFLIGQGGVEAGLEEGVLLLREGDKAIFIMPPYLAHGLVGDEKKIPPMAVIVYDVDVLRIN
jgi:FKBP-type peptidyl-prolyl cis-trans isomerase FkpA